MIHHLQLDATSATVLTAVVIVGGALVGIIRWAWPKWRSAASDAVKMRDSIIGRDEIRDSITGRVLAPALPGIGVRMDAGEQQQEQTRKQLSLLAQQQSNLTETVRQLAEAQLKQHHIEQRVDDHEKRIGKLEAAEVERIVTRAESAQAWKTVEAAIHATPGDLDAEPDDAVDAETVDGDDA